MIHLYCDFDYVSNVVIKQCFKNEEFVGYQCSFWLGKLCIEFSNIHSLDNVIEKLSAFDSFIENPDSDFNRCYEFNDLFSKFYSDDEDDEE